LVVFKNICMQFFAMYQLHAPSRRKSGESLPEFGAFH